MKNWWRKWSYQIPLALGDALWEVLVVQFAAFLMKTEGIAFASWEVVGDIHRDDRSHAGEAVDHDGDQGAVA